MQSFFKYVLVISGLNCKKLLHYHPVKMGYGGGNMLRFLLKLLQDEPVSNSDAIFTKFTGHCAGPVCETMIFRDICLKQGSARPQPAIQPKRTRFSHEAALPSNQVR
jgi:hypothetical protein